MDEYSKVNTKKNTQRKKIRCSFDVFMYFFLFCSLKVLLSINNREISRAKNNERTNDDFGSTLDVYDMFCLEKFGVDSFNVLCYYCIES